MKEKLSTKKLVLGMCAVAAVLLGVWLALARQPPTLDRQAAVYRQAVASLDSRTLYSLVSTQEKQALGLTQEELTRLVDVYLRPRLERSNPAEDMESPLKQDNMKMVLMAREIKGRKVVLEGLLYPSPDGPRASLTEDLVLMGLTLDAASNFPGGNVRELYLEALPTLDQAMADLRSTGLAGLYEAPTGNVIRWEVFEARFRDIARQQQMRRLR